MIILLQFKNINNWKYEACEALVRNVIAFEVSKAFYPIYKFDILYCYNIGMSFVFFEYSMTLKKCLYYSDIVNFNWCIYLEVQWNTQLNTIFIWFFFKMVHNSTFESEIEDLY